MTNLATLPPALREAVDRNGPAVLSIPWDRGSLHLRTRFLGADAGWVWIEEPSGYDDYLLVAVELGDRATIHFKAAGAAHRFHTQLTRLDAASPASGHSAGRLYFEPPTHIEEIQRRSCYRAPVHGDGGPEVRAWKIPSHAILRDKPAPSTEIKARLHDLSANGACFICQGRNGERLTLEDSQRFRITLDCLDGEILLDARTRYCLPLPGGALRVGVEFKESEHDVRSKQCLAMLTAVVAELQREEAKTLRAE